MNTRSMFVLDTQHNPDLFCLRIFIRFSLKKTKQERDRWISTPPADRIGSMRYIYTLNTYVHVYMQYVHVRLYV